MADPSIETEQIRNWLTRIQAGDLSARDEMIEGIYGRLESLARRMLRRFPNVRPLAQTDDVLQNALIRLLRTLPDLKPESVRDFFAFASAQMRWVLLDLARQVRSRKDIGAPPASSLSLEDSGAGPFEPPAEPNDPEDLEKWYKFHKAVEKLPAEEREVVGLIFYHGWSQAAVAELFQISERTVRRRWTAGMEKLQKYFPR